MFFSLIFLLNSYKVKMLKNPQKLKFCQIYFELDFEANKSQNLLKKSSKNVPEVTKIITKC